MLGYKGKIYMLPFDHRDFLIRSFSLTKPLSKADKNLISYYKSIIFQGFLLSRRESKYKKEMSILIDEEFGSDIINLAKQQKILLAVSTEKSGKEFFEFEHGKNFGKFISKVNPDFVKVLIRYDLKNKKQNQVQLKKLKTLNDFCKAKNKKFLIELLTPKTENKAQETVSAISQIQGAGIDPDIWKIEAYDKKSDWEAIIRQIKNTKTRKNVSIIMLGRGEDMKQVQKWISIAKKFDDINGFAVGRTIFYDAIISLYNGKISKNRAIEIIKDNYLKIINFWEK